MTGFERSEDIDSIIADLSEAIRRSNMGLVIELRDRLQAQWLDAIHEETKNACMLPEVTR